MKANVPPYSGVVGAVLPSCAGSVGEVGLVGVVVEGEEGVVDEVGVVGAMVSGEPHDAKIREKTIKQDTTNHKTFLLIGLLPFGIRLWDLSSIRSKCFPFFRRKPEKDFRLHSIGATSFFPVWY